MKRWKKRVEEVKEETWNKLVYKNLLFYYFSCLIMHLYSRYMNIHDTEWFSKSLIYLDFSFYLVYFYTDSVWTVQWLMFLCVLLWLSLAKVHTWYNHCFCIKHYFCIIFYFMFVWCRGSISDWYHSAHLGWWQYPRSAIYFDFGKPRTTWISLCGGGKECGIM